MGLTQPLGYARRVTFDADGRTLTDTDATGRTTTLAWSSADELLAATDAAELRTTTIYDHVHRPTDTYGPAPTSCFGADRRPVASCTVPHTRTGYDEGIAGLAAAYWTNATLSGAPLVHDTGVGNAGGALDRDWGTAAPVAGIPADGWSARYTGEITMATAGTYSFRLDSDDGARLLIDDTQVIDTWSATYATSGFGSFANTTAGTRHRIRVEVHDTTSTAKISLRWTPPGGSQVVVPGAALGPRYGLVTSTTDADGNTSATEYAQAQLGVPTATVVDPGGLALRSTTGYEPVGTGYVRRTSRTLPSGAASTVTYAYSTAGADNPCTVATESIPQAGRLESSTAADPDGAGPLLPIVRHYRYDDAGRVIATRVGSSEPWTCTTYDARGRVTSRTDRVGHAMSIDFATPGVVTTTYEDSAGATRTTRQQVDLLGRPISYTDEWGTITRTSYDRAGRATDTTRQYAGQGQLPLTAMQYDAAGRVTALDEYVTGAARRTTYTYDAAGRPDTTTLPNGVTSTATYDPNQGRLTGLRTDHAGTELWDSAVTRTLAGSISSETLGADLTRDYGYDRAGRLVEVDENGTTSRQYAYDPNTNRCAEAAACDGSYTYDNADRLTSSPYATGYSYDEHGNLTSADVVQPTANDTVADTQPFTGASAPTTHEIHPGQAGTITASVDYNDTPDSVATSSGTLAAGASTTVPISVDGQANVAVDLAWGEGTGTRSGVQSTSVTPGAPALVAVEPNAAGEIAGSLTWGGKQNPIDTIHGHVENLNYQIHWVRVSGNGWIDVSLSWPDRAVDANLDLELRDAAGNLLKSSTNLSGTSERIQYQVTGITGFPAYRDYQLVVRAVGTGDDYNLWGGLPQRAQLDLDLLDSTGQVVATSTQTPNAAERTIALADAAPGAYQFRISSADYTADPSLQWRHAAVGVAPVRARIRNASGVTVAETTRATGSLSLAYRILGGNPHTLELTDTDTGLPVPAWNATVRTTTLATDTIGGSNGGLATTHHNVTADGPGLGYVSLAWQKSVLGVYADITLVLKTQAGQVIGSARDDDGFVDFNADFPAAGTYIVDVVDNTVATPSYTLRVIRPSAANDVSVAIVDDAGTTVASSTSGPAPRTATATVAPGDYRIVVTPTSGRGVWTLTADYPPAERRLDIAYDGNDHATRIDNGTTTVAETLDPGGRVIARQVTDNASNTVVEDLTVGDDAPGDAAAYERHADGTRLTYLFAAGLYLTHSSSSGSRWGVATVDGDLVGTTDLTGAFTPNAVADEYGGVPGGGERLEWLGTHRRFAADTISGLVRMGVRLYDPALGRFLQTDPIEGGVDTNDYGYTRDPVNQTDLNGAGGRGSGCWVDGRPCEEGQRYRITACVGGGRAGPRTCRTTTLTYHRAPGGINITLGRFLAGFSCITGLLGASASTATGPAALAAWGLAVANCNLSIGGQAASERAR